MVGFSVEMEVKSLECILRLAILLFVYYHAMSLVALLILALGHLHVGPLSCQSQLLCLFASGEVLEQWWVTGSALGFTISQIGTPFIRVSSWYLNVLKVLNL